MRRHTLRCQINVPPAYYFFDFCPTPWSLLGLPRLLILRKLTFFTNPSFHFLSLLVLFTPNFHGKIACFCIYFDIMLYDNLFLFFPSLYNHLRPFLKFQPPPFILTPLAYYISEFFPTPLIIRTLQFIWHLRVHRTPFNFNVNTRRITIISTLKNPVPTYYFTHYWKHATSYSESQHAILHLNPDSNYWY